MESVSVLMPRPTFPYLEQELDKRFKLLRLWDYPHSTQFLKDNANSIRAIVVNSVDPAKKLIEALPKLEIVTNYGVGVDNIDLNRCKERRIRVTNTPDVLTDEAADLAIGLILALLRRLCECDRYVRSGRWKLGAYKLTTKMKSLICDCNCEIRMEAEERVLCSGMGQHRHPSGLFWNGQRTNQIERGDREGKDDFSGKRVGIIGLGRIGMAVARRAEAFNCSICYHSRTKKPESQYKYYPSVVELASNCDILVVACSLTKETHGIIDRKIMDALGPKGALINIGRGKHVDEKELVSALLEGRLGGAAMDVFENEPHVPQELFGLENVVLSPHIGSATVETRTAMADVVIGNLEAHFRGKTLLTPLV
ncbi:hypothetical protein L6164_004383 [Bauhinia variegata]|uniref:Uncharacterized protein n=1 Tax=Bauhinia variegata TaxID=167791 RepID=A0ACB9Q3P5_BAUVA|nr:hypothetical protein L6164_004383 [Bauhinia variegata]